MIRPSDPVRLLMSQPVLCVSPKTAIREVAQSMVAHGFGIAVVLDGGDPVGTVTKTDVVQAVADGGDVDVVWAADVMSPEPPYVTPETPIVAAAERLVAANMRYVTVVEEDELVGIVSIFDLLKVLTAAAMAAAAA